MEAVAAALVSGLLALAGVVVTVHNSRKATTAQHVEQTGHLVNIRQDIHRLNDRVDSLAANHEILFNMVADVDLKVTKPAKKKQVSNGSVDGSVHV